MKKGGQSKIIIILIISIILVFLGLIISFYFLFNDKPSDVEDLEEISVEPASVPKITPSSESVKSRRRVGGETGGGSSGGGGGSSGGGGGGGSSGGGGGGGGSSPDQGPDCTTDEECSDGLYCNGGEKCVEGKCQVGSLDVDDGIGCTIDNCDEENDEVTHTPDNSLCQNGLFCDGVEVCNLELDCQSGTPPSIDDGVGCTRDSCDEGENENDDAGKIVHDTSDCGCEKNSDCDDSNSCTDDICTDQLTCSNVNNDENSCDDGLFCIINDHCFDGSCVGNPKPVDDEVSCTLDSCDEVIDEVVHIPENIGCDDELYCNGAEVCNVLDGCKAGTPPSIDDGVGCTIDSCDEGDNTIRNTPDNSLCQNGLFCDGAEVCNLELDCQDGTDPNCDDGVSCTVDSCDEGDNKNDNAGQCLQDTSDCECEKNSDCDDSNSCTDDICTDQLTCSNVNNNENSCDDGFFCIVSDRCFDGSCVGDQRQVDDGVSCTLDSCDEVNDEVVHIPKNSICDDELYCNGAEVCHVTEDCQAGTPPSIDDGVSCTIDSCDEETDTIDHSRDDNLCENYGCQVGSCSENGCEFQTNPSCNRPESKIVSDEDEDIEGTLEMKLQKKEGDSWITKETISENIVVPAKGIVRLDLGRNNLGDDLFEGWNEKNIVAAVNEEGYYRVYASFAMEGKETIEDSWKIKVEGNSELGTISLFGRFIEWLKNLVVKKDEINFENSGELAQIGGGGDVDVEISIATIKDDYNTGEQILLTPTEMPEMPERYLIDICSCKDSYPDKDNDGVDDCVDECPSDPNKVEKGICGCVIADEDSDDDGIIDCLEDTLDNVKPLMPTGLFVSLLSLDKAKITWNDNAFNEEGYIIERKVRGGDYSQVGEVGENVEKYLDPNLDEEEYYEYRIKAKGKNLDSDYGRSMEIRASEYYLDRTVICDRVNRNQISNNIKIYNGNGDGETNNYHLLKSAANSIRRFDPAEEYKQNPLFLVFREGNYFIDGYIGKGNYKHIKFRDLKYTRILGCGDVKFDIKGDITRTADKSIDALQIFRFEKGDHFSIEGFKIDGNVDQMNMEEGVGEGSGIGMHFRGNSNYLIKNMCIHHNSLDGIYLGQGWPTNEEGAKIADKNVRIQEVVLENNARLGILVHQVRNVWISNSRFENNGRTDSEDHPGMSPRAGVDVEPDFFTIQKDENGENYHNLGYFSDVLTGEILIENSRLNYNVGAQFLAALGVHIREGGRNWPLPRVEGVTIRNSDFITSEDSLVNSLTLAVKEGIIENSFVDMRKNNGEMKVSIHTGSSNLKFTKNDELIQTTVKDNTILSEDLAINNHWGRHPITIEGNIIKGKIRSYSWCSWQDESKILKNNKIIIPFNFLNQVEDEPIQLMQMWLWEVGGNTFCLEDSEASSLKCSTDFPEKIGSLFVNYGKAYITDDKYLNGCVLKPKNYEECNIDSPYSYSRDGWGKSSCD